MAKERGLRKETKKEKKRRERRMYPSLERDTVSGHDRFRLGQKDYDGGLPKDDRD